MNFWTEVYLDNSVQKWLEALSTFLLSFLFFKILIHTSHKKLSTTPRINKTMLDDLVFAVLKGTKTLFLLIISLVFASHLIEMLDKYSLLLHKVFVFSLSIQIGIWSTQIINLFVSKLTEENREKDAAKATTVGALGFFGKMITWAFVSLLLLTNLGIDVSTLIAGLGVSGIAVALAVQNILSDLFASLSIVLDKPFVIGDLITLGTDTGTVEHIGLKTTRLVSNTGEQLIFSNSDLLKSRIRNFKRMRERKVILPVVVDAGCSKQKLEQVLEIVTKAVQAQTSIRLDHCNLVRFSQNGIEFELAYDVLSPNVKIHLELQQKIQLEILDQFQQKQIPLPQTPSAVLVARAQNT